MSQNNPITATQAWLKSVIIGFRICPFAEHVVNRNTVQYQLDESTDIKECLANLITECEHLDNNFEIATTLVIYTDAFSDFDAYLDYVALAEDLLIAQDYEGIYQLASFHPEYCFAGEAPDDAANYTNRSPYPMIHILRESDLEQAIASHPDPEGIPQRNIDLTRSMGLKKMQALLAACYQKPE
jgi:hypothetical protein